MSDGGVDMNAPFPPLKAIKGGRGKGKVKDTAKPGVEVKDEGATVTISGPGITTITMTDAQLADVSGHIVAETKDIKKGYAQMSNSGDPDNLTAAAKDKLRHTVERIERLEEEKKEIAEQIKEVYGEAKALGYDTKALRAIIRRRKQDPDSRAEHEAILEVYLDALGEL